MQHEYDNNLEKAQWKRLRVHSIDCQLLETVQKIRKIKWIGGLNNQIVRQLQQKSFKGNPCLLVLASWVAWWYFISYLFWFEMETVNSEVTTKPHKKNYHISVT